MRPAPVRLTFELADEQLDAIAARVADRLAARMPRPEPASRYMATSEVADFLRCPKRRVYELVGDGRLTRHGDGRRLLLLREEVERLAASTLTRR